MQTIRGLRHVSSGKYRPGRSRGSRGIEDPPGRP